MAKSQQLKKLLEIIKAAHSANKSKKTSKEVLEHSIEFQKSRRKFIEDIGKIGAVGLASTYLSPFSKAFALPSSSKDVAIVGAGLAGLACAYELKRKGTIATLYEANSRIGGRCFSNTTFFPGQSCEIGGELIDNLHKTMIGYAKEFGLTLEDVNKNPGEVTYFFNGQHYPEHQVVDEFREFVSVIQDDLHSLSGDVTALNFTDHDRYLDNISLLDYLNGKNSQNREAPPIVKKAILEAYLAEYGLEAYEQSALNFLLFIHADKRSKFTPFGVFSDERYHIVEGNDGVVKGLTSRLNSQINVSMNLVKVRKTSSGKIELTFTSGSKTLVKTHDHVVLAIPFTILRNIQLDSNLNLSSSKINAIQKLGYGSNSKMMVGFNGRPWSDLGGNGASYSDLTYHQTAWETNYSLANSSRGIITDYSSGVRGLNISSTNLQKEVSNFLSDFNKVFPGAKNYASKTSSGNYKAILQNWTSNNFSKGSYTCYKPGQFTSIAGHEGTSQDNLYFAGEHANSFYVWQGFMEGACLSGIDAANEILSK